MKDHRAEALAEVLVRHSTAVREGDVCVVWAEVPAQPLALAVYEELLRAGAMPMVALTMEEQDASLVRLASDEQLEWVSPPFNWLAEQADVVIHIRGSSNTHAMFGADPGRQARRQAAFAPMMETMMNRTASGELRFCTTLFPTSGYAADADMALADYESLYYRACFCDQVDSLDLWRRQSSTVERLAEWMSGREEVRITAPGVDLHLNVEGRSFVAGTGTQNMPDGELFTGPVEDSAAGEIHFDYPTSFWGRDVGGVSLRFEGGRVVDATAESNEEFLIEVLDSDAGARRLGEFGIGANYGVTRFTGDALLDEKIGGTFHLALGSSYPQTGGRNQSAIHWDMVCDLRANGRIEVDGIDLQAEGRFLVEGLDTPLT